MGASNAQFVPAVYWDTSGKLLANGKLFFFARGTNVPQTVYADLDGTTPLNAGDGSVTLDGSGHKTIYLGPKAYTVWAYNAAGAQQFEPVDVQGSGAGAGSFGAAGTETVGLGNGIIVNTYTDLQGLASPYDVVYVAGRASKGDGGQGWFARIPGSSATPDSGIILKAGAIVYARLLDGWIDPRWYGLAYGTGTDQSTVASTAEAASVRFGLPVIYSDVVWVTGNRTSPAGASIRCSGGGNFQAPSAVTWTLPAGVVFEAESVAFGAFVQPKFGIGVAREIRLSWMGEGTSDARLVKLTQALDATNLGPQRMVVDRAVSTATNFAFPAGGVVTWGDGAPITVTGPVTVSIPCHDYQGLSPALVYPDIASILSLVFGSQPARPEWFGAKADGTTDDSIAFFAAAKTGNVQLRDGKTYRLGALWSSTPSPLTIKGGVVSLGASETLGTGVLALQETKIVNVSGSWFAGSFLAAVEAEFPETFTATTKSVVGCAITGDPFFPMFDGAPKINNAHLDVVSAQLLATDTDGKVVDAKAGLPASAPILGTLPDGTIVNMGNSPSLDLLSFSSMFFASWSAAPLAGTLTLTNPLKFIYMVDNAGAGVDITLPTPGATHSTIAIFFPKTRSNPVTLHGNFPSVPASLVTTSTAVLLYYDRASSGWYLIHSDA